MSFYSKSLRKPHVWSGQCKILILLFRGCLYTSEIRRSSVFMHKCSLLLSHWWLYRFKADEWISHQMVPDRLLGFSIQVSYQSPKWLAGKLRWRIPVLLSTRLSAQQFTHDTECVGFPSKQRPISLQHPLEVLQINSWHYLSGVNVKFHSLKAQKTASPPLPPHLQMPVANPSCRLCFWPTNYKSGVLMTPFLDFYFHFAFKAYYTVLIPW